VFERFFKKLKSEPSSQHKIEQAVKEIRKGGKQVENLNLGKKVTKIGDYEVFENGELFFRTVYREHWEHLKNTGELLGSGECTTSPIQAFSESYDGVLVQFKVERGTINRLEEIGIAADDNSIVVLRHPTLKPSTKQWNQKYARFKKEGNQVNIQLGYGEALKRFNEGMLEYKFIKEIKK